MRPGFRVTLTALLTIALCAPMGAAMAVPTPTPGPNGRPVDTAAPAWAEPDPSSPRGRPANDEQAQYEAHIREQAAKADIPHAGQGAAGRPNAPDGEGTDVAPASERVSSATETSSAEASSTTTVSAKTSASGFIAGNLISDANFYNGAAMSEAAIQTFLEKQVGTCANSNCLAVYRTDTPTRTWSFGTCSTYEGGTAESAARIIYKVQRACGLSARVILVTLQKEQSLLTNPAPSDGIMRKAMGYGCPDTSACDSTYYGFFNQVFAAGRQLTWYGNPAGSFTWLKVGQPNYILWHPDSARCGGADVTIANRATAALYYYTPYQPNAAALAKLYGVGDDCSSYGNRNFWRMYRDWFGSPTAPASVALNRASMLTSIDAAGTLWFYPASGTGSWLPRAGGHEGFTGVVHLTGAGDIGGDGLRDLLIVDRYGTLWAYPTDGKGGLSARVQVGTGYGGVVDLVSAGDADGNDTQDLYTLDGSGRLRLHAGTGVGRFEPARTVASGWGGYDLVGAGDFTGDLLADLVVRTPSGELRVQVGNGRGGWSDVRRLRTGWSGYTAMAVPGDFDGDLRNDLVARAADGGLFLFRGDGAGDFFNGIRVGNGWDEMRFFDGPGAPGGTRFVPRPGLGDVDGNGVHDVGALDSAGALWAYPSNGRGAWLPRFNLVTGMTAATAMTGAGDLDGDGRRDLIVRDRWGTLWRYPIRTSTTLDARVKVGTGWSGLRVLIGVGDMNGDRRPDLMAIDGDDRLRLYRGDGSGGFRPALFVGSGWTTALRTVFSPGDFNRDGRNDLMAVDSEGRLRLYPGTGSGGVSFARFLGSGWSGYSAVFSPGDFSGDRHPDVMARTASGDLRLFRGDGSGGIGFGATIGSGWDDMSRVF